MTTLGGSCTHPPSPSRAWDSTLMVHFTMPNFPLIYTYCCPTRLKTANLVKFWNFGGSCTHPRSTIRAKCGMPKQTYVICLQAKCHLDQLIVLPLVQKIPYLTIFSTSTICDGATLCHRDKVECGCKTTNLPLSNSIKIISDFKQLNGNHMFTNFTIQKHDGQTNTNMEPWNFFASGGMQKNEPNHTQQSAWWPYTSKTFSDLTYRIPQI